MSKEKKFERFDVLEVPLEARNLIEASAGTGKTYSIAILALRLLLEKKLHIKEILMVTFTKAAVAELEERIRQFLRKAHRFSEGEEIDDETIAKIVSASMESSGAAETVEILKEAILYLDEIAVMTIHSFCQQTLNEFAFETRQFFGAEVSNDNAEILETETQKFWRKNVATMETELLQLLISNGLSLFAIREIVKNQLNGKKFYYYDYEKTYDFSREHQLNQIQKINALNREEEAELESLKEYVQLNVNELRKTCLANTHAKKYVEKLADPEEFLNFIWENRDKKYVMNCFGEVLEESAGYEQAREQKCAQAKTCLHELYCFAIQQIEGDVRKYKASVNQLTFDDLIENLHTALVQQENKELAAGLQKKYRAVFVDEFQDTDRQQYEIFDTAFENDTIVFYIGDPKQSIYGWRKADIFTYFKAYDAVNHRYSMNVNYRSTPELIAAMNHFFYPRPGFDTFHFEESAHSIDYILVEAPETFSRGNLYFGDAPAVPITLDANFKNAADIGADVAAQIFELLTNEDYKIIRDGKARRIAPSDIGILVRKKNRGEEIRQQLAKYRIPAVTVLEARVLQSAEANEILYLLEAISDPNTPKINRALLSIFTGFHSRQILQLNSEETTALFKKYKYLWEKRGVYESLTEFLSDFGVRNHLLKPETENGERIITNLYHLIELLYKTATFKNYSAPELIKWLKRNRERAQTEGDEWEQRIESDEDAVKIVTIHKSKGLQYPIVFAPELDFCESKKDRLCDFKDEETNEYVSANKKELSEQQLKVYLAQQEQENRRLLYVALTRAVYKVFIYRNTYFSESTLTHFTNAIKADGVLIESKDAVILDKGVTFCGLNRIERAAVMENVRFELLEPDWRRMSYSMLAAKTESIRKSNWFEGEDHYDRFIFNDLAKGMATGNMLHYLFENIHFDNEDGWASVIADAITQFAPAKRNVYEPMLPELLRQVMEADVNGFSLNKINSARRIHELEFDFPVGLFTGSDLEFYEGVSVKPFGKLEGIMNGKIDLFFEHEGKYYVLDWKSSYLGNSMSDYDEEGVAKAMKDHNYHLQYLIYTVAMKKYLQSRLPGFEYERDFGGAIYCFVRGMRSGMENGVFFAKPALEVVERLERVFG